MVFQGLLFSCFKCKYCTVVCDIIFLVILFRLKSSILVWCNVVPGTGTLKRKGFSFNLVVPSDFTCHIYMYVF